MATHSVAPNGGGFIGDSVFVSTSYIFSDKRFISDRARNATNHSFGFDVFAFFLQSKGYAKLGYRVDDEDTQGSQFDYLGHAFSGTVQLPLPLKFKTNMSYRYSLRDYKNPTPSIGEEREDKKHSYRITLSRKFLDHFQFKVDWSHVETNFNLLSVDSRENVLNMGFSFSY